MSPSIPHRIRAGLVAACSLLAATAALSQELSCPQPGSLVQVSACQPDDQLRQSYIGYCSDNRRLYARDSDTCSSFEHFLQAKNTTRWESGDGRFEGYRSCQAGGPAALPAPRMSLERQGAITVVACRYGAQATLTHRTRARCSWVDNTACAAGADPTACRARCD